VKRWWLLFLGGTALLGLGTGFFLKEVYQTWPFPSVFYYLTLQFLPRWIRGVVLWILGTAAVITAVVQLSRSLLAPFLRPGQPPIAEVLYHHRQRHRGPKIVAIGGGNGLSVLLRGLKEYTTHITAIVTVADDGGSSGRLRRQLGVLPPGDFRNCLAALADDEALLTQLFQYRFGEGAGLDGHSFGNLFITAMVGVTGSFERAIVESGRVLAIEGRIVPSTLENVTLCAVFQEAVSPSGSYWVAGESAIPKAGLPIERVFLQPADVPAYPEAVRAILDADLIVIGPGSLYTSILPNLLVRGITQALRAARAPKVYVCNVATQQGETDGYSVGDHVAALERHVGPGLFQFVLANSRLNLPLPDVPSVQAVLLGPVGSSYQVITADLADHTYPWRHDSRRLARALLELHSRSSVDDNPGQWQTRLSKP